MSNFPQTRDAMRRAGYEFLNEVDCKSCHARIEWWRTPGGKKIPMDVPKTDHSHIVTHWSTCKHPDQHRQRGSRPAETAPAAPSSSSPPVGCMPTVGLKIYEREVSSLRFRAHAVAAVLIYEDGRIAAWDPKLDPEDARNSVIAAANFLRDEIRKASRSE